MEGQMKMPKKRPIKPLGKQTANAAGFPLIQFEDHYDHPCRLVASSLAVYEQPGTSAVWLGTADAALKSWQARLRTMGSRLIR